MYYYDDGSVHGKKMSQSTGANGNGSYSQSDAGPQNGTQGRKLHHKSDSHTKHQIYRNGSAQKRDSFVDYNVKSQNSKSKNGSNQNRPSNGNTYAAKKAPSVNGGTGRNGNSSGKQYFRAGGANGNGNGNGGGSDIGSWLRIKWNKIKKTVLAWVKRVLRSFYFMGKTMRIFIASAGGFVVICLIVIFSVVGSRHKRAEAMEAQLALATTAPTIAASATPEPTPEPTPTIWIEKGAEGEDVMDLQKRLMELGYLDIDEPTSYFGHATKEAVKRFQRQHDLQQDGICGNDTVALIYAEEAKPYVMYEGAEGDDIAAFQEQLVELGYLDDNQVTGYYGTDTVSAVKKFQHRNYLTEDGKTGEKTLEAINSPDARVSYTREQEIIAEKKKQAALARAQSAEGRIDKLISIAKKQLGDPYVLGKSGPDSFDCSGLVVYCLRQVNVYTRRLNASGLSKTSSWTKVSSLSDVERGDLLFFRSDDSSSIGHVGIYIGGGEMIDASSANGKVVRRSAKSSYWRRNFVVARRPIE